MADRKWVPEDYMDEITPAPRATPSAWVLPLDGAGFALAPADAVVAFAARTALTEGDIVRFSWIEDICTTTAIWDAEGKWQLACGTEPQAPDDGELTVVALGDPESCAPSMNEFIRLPSDGHGPLTMEFYAWARRPQPFVFHAGAFHPIAEA